MQFLTKEEQKLVVEAIGIAEKGTSAEIKVHIDKNCSGEAVDKAVEWFYRLKMDRTQLRNGVLIYVAYKDRKSAIIGDSGINDLVGENFWEETVSQMVKGFAAGNNCMALIGAIGNIQEKLQHFFPYQSDDINELNDDISYGE